MVNGREVRRIASIASSLVILALCFPAHQGVASEKIVVDYRRGGYVHQHIQQAELWLKQGVQIVVADSQMSAAAIQVVYFGGRGGRICVKPGVSLYFHPGRSRGGARTNPTLRYLGVSLPEGWYDPSRFGLKICSR